MLGGEEQQKCSSKSLAPNVRERLIVFHTNKYANVPNVRERLIVFHANKHANACIKYPHMLTSHVFFNLLTADRANPVTTETVVLKFLCSRQCLATSINFSMTIALVLTSSTAQISEATQ